MYSVNIKSCGTQIMVVDDLKPLRGMILHETYTSENKIM